MKLSYLTAYNVKATLMIILLVFVIHNIFIVMDELEAFRSRCFRLQHAAEMIRTVPEIDDYIDSTFGGQLTVDLFKSGKKSWEKIKYIYKVLSHLRYYFSVVCFQLILISIFFKYRWLMVFSIGLFFLYSNISLVGYVSIIIFNIILAFSYVFFSKKNITYLYHIINQIGFVHIFIFAALIYGGLIASEYVEDEIKRKIDVAAIAEKAKTCSSYRSKQQVDAYLYIDLDNRILKIASDLFLVGSDNISINSCLIEELGANADDMSFFQNALQDEFNMIIPGDDIREFHTLVDVRNYVIKHGVAK